MDMHKYKNAMFLGRQQVGVQLQVVESGLSDCNLFLSTLLPQWTATAAAARAKATPK